MLSRDDADGLLVGVQEAVCATNVDSADTCEQPYASTNTPECNRAVDRGVSATSTQSPSHAFQLLVRFSDGISIV